MAHEIETRLAYLGFQLIRPSPPLRPYIEQYWRLRSVSLMQVHEEYMHPLGGFGVVFNLGPHVMLDGQPIEDPVFLDGVNTVSRAMRFEGAVDLLGIRFQVGGAYPFLSVPLHELRNETGLLNALSQPPLLRLHEQVYDAVTLEQRIGLLETWLLDRLHQGKPRDALIPASLQWIRQEQGLIDIADLAQRLPLSQRQFERLYLSQVGMPPKLYARLLRVEAARLALKQRLRNTATEIGLAAGFYDQSHFIREFTAIVGLTPLSYRQRSLKQRGSQMS